MKFIKQSLILLLSFAFVFLWQQTILSQYTIHTFVVLVLIYLLLTARKKNFDLLNISGDYPSVFVLTTMILLLVFSTGGLTSMLFFLLYFLGFGITFVFEPSLVFIFIIGVVLVFLPSALNNDVVGNFLSLGSLLLIAPFAFIFGRHIKEDEKEALKSRSKKRK